VTMNKNLLHNDQFYYQVDNHNTVSKNEAFMLANGDVSKISFYQQNHIWDNVNLSVEPEQSFSSLCEENCKLYRQHYDHVCLWLSSGYDSQTILKSFIDSGALIDEIAFKDRSEYYSDPEVPFIEQSIRNYQRYYNPRVKINRVKIDLKYHENFYNKYAESIWYLGPGSNLRYTKSTANYILNFHDEFVQSKIKQHTRVDIFGKDKPKLDLRNGKWYVQSNDLVYFDIIGAPVECFYCNKLLPELHIKQIHMSIRFFESLNNLTHELVHQIQNNDVAYYEQWNLAMGRYPINCVQSKDSSIKSNFANNLKSKDAVKLINHLQKTTKQVSNVEGYRSDFLKDLPDPTIDLHQWISGKDWFIRDQQVTIPCNQN